MIGPARIRRARRARAPTYYSVQIAPGRHVHLAPEYLQYINHGCEPNVHFDVARGRLICLCDIAAGDEALFFYPSTEWQLLLPFPCHCGSPRCIGMVEGAAHLPPAVASRYRFTEHIQEKLAARDGEHQDHDRQRTVAPYRRYCAMQQAQSCDLCAK